VTANGISKDFGISRNGTDKIPLFNRQLAILVTFSLYHADTEQTFSQFGLG
jgi:hypothetical protein